MSIRLHIPLTGVYRRTGQILHTETYTSELSPTAFGSPDYGLLLHWPHTVDWLSARASLGRLPPRDFLESEQHLERICRRYGTTRERLCPPGRPDFFHHRFLRVLDVTRATPVTLELSVDTDAKSFAQAAEAQQAADRGDLQIAINVIAFDGLSGALLDEQGEILVSLKPVKPVPAFTGCVALDLGNTSSSVACLPPGKDATPDLRLLRADGRGRLVADAEPTLSHVRIDEVLTWAPEVAPAGAGPRTRRFPGRDHDDMPQAVRWVIGSIAAAGTTNGLVLGAKRMVASSAWEETQKLLVKHNIQYTNPPAVQPEQIDLVNRVPVELLACRLLQQFTRAAQDDDGTPAGWPRHLALTYPTTYSPQEIDRLRRTVYRAWLRLQFKRQTPRVQAEGDAARKAPPGADPHLERCAGELQRRLASRAGGAAEDDPLIRLMLDEASAAAFFFLYRKILESPGGLAAFTYRYPDGLNLLLYDCGGGTTDIALVSARTDPANPACLRIKVRGRTGVRHFGGDDVTRAVCRLLKAKIARELARDNNQSKVPSPPSPPEPGATLEARLSLRSAVEGFLAQMAAFDAEPSPLVPTRFERQRMDAESNRRREHANTLWNWGEQLKHKLESAESVKLGDLGLKLGPNQSRLADALFQYRRNDDVALKDLVERLEKVAVHRWEVDALIGQTVKRSVDNCNGLIRGQLGEPQDGRSRTGLPDDEELVHWVVASGNGSRYPLIREALLAGLNIPNLVQDGRFTHDPLNLKHAVAKGAVLALATIRGQGNVRIEFDTDLSECLPYDIGYNDLRSNAHHPLFEQGQRYDKLGARPVPLAARAGEGLEATAPRQFEFTLVRRFPGDGEGSDRADGGEGDELTRKCGWSDFVTYHFDEGIKGDLTVSYDQEAHEFAVRDKSGAEGKPMAGGAGEDYRSPPQRGDL
jgi:molecular chaperone DnaK (HSP70)